jgi:HD superfamily phosphodiesterase
MKLVVQERIYSMEARKFDLIREKALEFGGTYGLEHSLRIIELVRTLAKGRSYNEEVIAFSAYVHDFGGYPKFSEPGYDHVIRSMEVLPEYIKLCPFSQDEEALIREIISSHHSRETPVSLEAILFRDADALDFLGYIGIARNLMRFGKEFQKALEAIHRHRTTLPGILHEEEAHEIAKTRMEEMDAFLSGLDAEHFSLITRK